MGRQVPEYYEGGQHRQGQLRRPWLNHFLSSRDGRLGGQVANLPVNILVHQVVGSPWSSCLRSPNNVNVVTNETALDQSQYSH